MAKILIAEDETTVGTFLATALGKKGHEVFVSPNGEHALETLQSNEGFDLLISDLKMPKMSGRQLIETMQKQLALADIPIIIMSGYEGIDEIDDLLKAGAMAFLAKPFSMEQLEEDINYALKHYRSV